MSIHEDCIFIGIAADYIPPKLGQIVHKVTGEVVGEHIGLWQFTIGQNVRLPGLSEKHFVSSKDMESNTIYVVPGQ
jgi:tRNA-specific 2-thiouridylase